MVVSGAAHRGHDDRAEAGVTTAKALVALLCFAGAMAAGLLVLLTFAGTSTDDTAAKTAYQGVLDTSGSSSFRARYQGRIVFSNGWTQDVNITMIFDGGTNARLDVTAAGSDAITSTFLSPNRPLSCRAWPSKGLVGSCRSGLPSGSDAGSITPYVLAAAGLVRSGVHVSPRGTRMIAGHAARCFLWFAAGASASSEECYGDGGEPLYLDFASRRGGILMRATDVSSDVTDADFAPPYPVVEQ